MSTKMIDKKAFRAQLDIVELVHGVGTDEHHACSIAAWNLFLTGELKDDIPACIHPQIGRFIISVQDIMPVALLNSTGYRDALARIAGTNVLSNEEVKNLLMAWLYEVILPTLQPVADKHGFGKEWSEVNDRRTAKIAQRAAADAYADAAAYSADADAAAAAYAAYAAAAAAYAAYAAAAAAYAAAAAAWQGFDIPALLNKFADLADEMEQN